MGHSDIMVMIYSFLCLFLKQQVGATTIKLLAIKLLGKDNPIAPNGVKRLGMNLKPYGGAYK